MKDNYTDAMKALRKTIEKIKHSAVTDDDMKLIEADVVALTRILFDNELKEVAKERANEEQQLKHFKHLAKDNQKSRNKQEQQEAMSRNAEINNEERQYNATDEETRAGFDADQAVRDEISDEKLKANYTDAPL